MARGLLPAAPNWWKICTVPPNRVTVDAGREAQQNRADVEMGLKTLSDHFQELGADFGEEIERYAKIYPRKGQFRLTSINNSRAIKFSSVHGTAHPREKSRTVRCFWGQFRMARD
ncbi:MAG: hypothetical protein ACO3JG_03775 [Luteolibacter sp.]